MVYRTRMKLVLIVAVAVPLVVSICKLLVYNPSDIKVNSSDPSFLLLKILFAIKIGYNWMAQIAKMLDTLTLRILMSASKLQTTLNMIQRIGFIITTLRIRGTHFIHFHMDVTSAHMFVED